MVGDCGKGKSAVINNIIGEAVAKQCSGCGCQSRTPSQVDKKLLINTNVYHCHFTELCLLSTRDSLCNIIEKMGKTNQRVILQRINLIIYVWKLGFYTPEDKEVYQNLKIAQQSISALVITGCDKLNDAKRTLIVERFKSGEYTKDFAADMGKGIYTVAFPDLCEYEVSSGQKKFFEQIMQEDRIKLHQLIEEASDAVDVLKINNLTCSIL